MYVCMYVFMHVCIRVCVYINCSAENPPETSSFVVNPSLSATHTPIQVINHGIGKHALLYL